MSYVFAISINLYLKRLIEILSTFIGCRTLVYYLVTDCVSLIFFVGFNIFVSVVNDLNYDVNSYITLNITCTDAGGGVASSYYNVTLFDEVGRLRLDFTMTPYNYSHRKHVYIYSKTTKTTTT